MQKEVGGEGVNKMREVGFRKKGGRWVGVGRSFLKNNLGSGVAQNRTVKTTRA
jgi:hypothetical protein